MQLRKARNQARNNEVGDNEEDQKMGLGQRQWRYPKIRVLPKSLDSLHVQYQRSFFKKSIGLNIPDPMQPIRKDPVLFFEFRATPPLAKCLQTCDCLPTVLHWIVPSGLNIPVPF